MSVWQTRQFGTYRVIINYSLSQISHIAVGEFITYFGGGHCRYCFLKYHKCSQLNILAACYKTTHLISDADLYQ